MAKLFANSRDPDLRARCGGLILVCIVCQIPFYGSPDYNGLRNHNCTCQFYFIFNLQ